ncbi:MAG: hypothetical protein A2566_03205 [Candidatus Zambryskibacteria bacterium RIFOXYD1_FULL_40_13]|nr:MAG: hypothetical protein UT25_C0002G0047 [Parcubacteria group bacterium GW2011_GWC1_39_12]KKR19454.1 MAG: hypothetical protein UT49_C0002G0300 [Parcubacteria group bacterium GW2011_GWF1_39_37]KKR35080.1 MAG: hypothetical protein UT68_C0005G0029 [Parcubacteria group bacterium GW2011_GWC2_40_10]KKR52403.1 MAG: hypothetical protein UT89_C0002G0204 [Parcubacteria group bacterium GW2011_GWE1_40_20]KKR69467.1 MAG: hypothetical protein UU11_C0001G0053 [Parcubacteria group bacterium GW2011_GWF2_40_
MRKFFPYILIIIILFGLFSPLSNVSADVASVVNYLLPAPKAGECSILSGEGIWNCFGWVGERIAYYAILVPASWLVWFSGMLLDFVINWTVVGMREHVAEMTGINTAWKVVRDIMNIAFIFLLVYEGIKTILGLSELKEIKKFISMVILASLLVNFSLFFTKVMIDASNIVTVGIYNAIIDTDKFSIHGQTNEIGGLSVPFMNAVGVTGFYSAQTFGEVSADAGGHSNAMIFYIGGAVILVILSFVFFAVATMFAIRYVTLLILLMLSPVAYMGMALPFVKPYATKWWKALNSQLLFAPIYMIMTSVVLTLMTSENFLKSSGSWDGLVKGGSTAPGGLGLIFNFFVVIALAIASLVISKSTSVDGSNYIKDATTKFSAFAGGAVMNSAGRVGRGSVGRVGDMVTNSETAKNMATSQGHWYSGFNRTVGKVALKTGNKAATSTFDARNTGAFGMLSSSTDVKFGKGADAKKVNFQKDLEAKATKQADYAKLLKPSDTAKERVTAEEEEKVRIADAQHANAQTALDALNKKRKMLEEKRNNASGVMDRLDIQKEIDALNKEIQTKNAGVAKLKTASDAAVKAKEGAEKEMAGLWEKRVNAYASTFSDESGVAKTGRYIANILKAGGVAGAGLSLGFGGVVSGMGGASVITTKGDKKVIARKIKGVIKDKKTKMTKEERKELIDKLANAEDSDEPAPVDTPAPETPPAPPTT